VEPFPRRITSLRRFLALCVTNTLQARLPGVWKIPANMAMRLRILASGSSGNCALLATEETRVLVDAGVPIRRLQRLLAAAGESLERIDAVFLTHEHADHIAAIDGLRHHPGIRLFANAATSRAVQEELRHHPTWQLFETGSCFTFRDLEVLSFPVPHDAHEPVGYRFTSGWEGDLFEPRRSLAWVTDLGHVPPHLREHLRECDVVAFESNHCPRLLEADRKRSRTLKQRISGRHGHLSNEAARDFLASVASPRWQRIFLTHLSRDCNSPAAVEAAFASVRALLGCELSIVGHGEGAALYEFA
jgi:phosphoribosyl 1,2-cyclic phosphodiesterase